MPRFIAPNESVSTRRSFLKLAGAVAAGGLLRQPALSPSATDRQGLCAIRFESGHTLAGWEAVLGDGTYARPGEPDVTEDDIATIHTPDVSELQANVRVRDIMAHNITFHRVRDPRALKCVHTAGVSFRLPYMPATTNVHLNGQTLEGGLFVWDGAETRRDYGIAFQWLINPWTPEFGEIRCWTDEGGGAWQAVGHLPVDTAWHTLGMVYDAQRQATALTIDGRPYPCQATATGKPETWGTEIDARLQVEIISLYPGAEGQGALHKAQFRDWSWIWEPATVCHTYIPTALQSPNATRR